jgi:hypothetical protein
MGQVNIAHFFDFAFVLLLIELIVLAPTLSVILDLVSEGRGEK